MKRILLPLMITFAMGCDGGGDDPPTGTRIDDILALTGDSAAGGDVYAARCQSCHGADGTGGVGPSLVDVVPPLSDNDLLTVIIDGVGTMPAAGDLEDQELADLLANISENWGS